MAAYNVWFTKEPGRYPSPFTAGWTVSDQVDYFAISYGEKPASISEYIAYDQLTPPKPFIAVTQDGLGNVVYDGGFPKIYNVAAPSLSITTFAQLTPTFKYFVNAMNFCANQTKVAAGNRKVLVLGDKVPGSSYSVKGTGNYDFYTTLTRLFNVAGWTPTFKDPANYSNTLNPTLAELEEYAFVLLVSSANGSTSVLTDAGEQALAGFRSLGSGIIIITDSGVASTSLATAYPLPGGLAYCATANKLSRNFGAWFEGNYNRDPVQVGFIRKTYGDHPLYAGLLDTEYVYGGDSESAVMIAPFTKYTKTSLPPDISLQTPERKIVQVTAKLKSGEAETFRVVFIYGEGALIKWQTISGVEIAEVDLGFGWQADASIYMDTIGLGTLSGSIYLNSTKVGELSSTDLGGPIVVWYSGSSYNLKVLDGDILRAALESPIQASADLRVKRVNLTDVKGPGMAPVNQKMKDWGLGAPRPHLVDAADNIRSLLPQNATIPGLGPIAKFIDPARCIRLIREFAAGNFPLADAGALVYATTAAAQAAMSTMKPPTLLDVFNTWPRFSNANWYPTQASIPAGSEALSWVWDSASNSPKSTLNSATYIGLVSKEKVENFVLESTFSSSFNDDDVIGYVVAARYTDKLETLSLLVNPGGQPAFSGMALVYNYMLPGQKTLAMNDQLQQWPANGGLSYYPGKDIRVGMVRRGSSLSFYATDWGDPNGPRKAEFQYDMNSDPVLAGLLGAQYYGYSTYSQANTIFKDVRFVGGVLWDVVVDAQANAVYRYNGTGWVVVPGLKPTNIYGTRRKLISPSTLQEFYLGADGSITKLTDPAPTVEMPISNTLFKNPVTGAQMTPRYRIFSAEYGWQSLPANLTMYYYQTLYFPAGDYWFIGCADDQLKVEIDGVLYGDLGGGYREGVAVRSFKVTLTAGNHKMKLTNVNIPAGTPGYWYAFILRADGSIFQEAGPGQWQTQDVIG